MITVETLKKKYGSFKEAKASLGIKATSWEDLAEKAKTRAPGALAKSTTAVVTVVKTKRSVAKSKKSGEVSKVGSLKDRSLTTKVKFSARLSTPFGNFDVGYSTEVPSGVSEGVKYLNGAYGQFPTELGSLETLIEIE